MRSNKGNKSKIISLVGLMGVGKSTVGIKLAEALGYYFIDSDQEIEDREKKTISEIFQNKGEQYFRDLEKSIIKEIIHRDENLVLSLGGGAFINDEIRELLKRTTTVIWLDADIDSILLRVGNKNHRPLLQNSDKRLVLENLACERAPFYQQANLKFDTSKESQDLLIDKILTALGNSDK